MSKYSRKIFVIIGLVYRLLATALFGQCKNMTNFFKTNHNIENMTISLFCFLFAVLMLISIHYEKEGNPNGISISVFQKLIGLLDFALCRFRIVSILLFSNNAVNTNPRGIEKIVWFRLFTVSSLSLIYEFLLQCGKYPKCIAPIIMCIYVLLLQVSLVNALLKPLFGVKRSGKGRELEQEHAKSKTVVIPTPKRSLLLALVNLLEIIISWGIIYRSIMPVIVNADKANYFSIVTITTLGYGDIAGGQSSLAQVAVSVNMLIFIIFSVCHITTILGTITSKEL